MAAAILKPIRSGRNDVDDRSSVDSPRRERERERANLFGRRGLLLLLRGVAATNPPHDGSNQKRQRATKFPLKTHLGSPLESTHSIDVIPFHSIS